MTPIGSEYTNVEAADLAKIIGVKQIAACMSLASHVLMLLEAIYKSLPNGAAVVSATLSC